VDKGPDTPVAWAVPKGFGVQPLGVVLGAVFCAIGVAISRLAWRLLRRPESSIGWLAAFLGDRLKAEKWIVAIVERSLGEASLRLSCVVVFFAIGIFVFLLGSYVVLLSSRLLFLFANLVSS
jgi:hypothetical protein